ncbi:MAG TPA: 2-hydroxychromene-2-carboxylate isomerase [Ramlibacter sp.]|nr:2-hydroxychromene-2-carboxylate isomerase [Ramlibacter sp.]
MSQTIDYYFNPVSPWTYLGHARFARLAADAGATVRLMPIDLGQVFPVSGGLPLGKRAPQRQAYRLTELARFSRHLQLPLNPQPRYFPVDGNMAARLVIAVDREDGIEPAMKLAGSLLAAVWAQERNIADVAVLAQLLDECSLPARRLEDANSPETQARYDAFTKHAIDAGVFGAPTFIADGEMFWGQDRLDFLERKLATNSTTRRT